jgi:hypothetical protein
LIHCKNFCKCHNVPSPSTIKKLKKKLKVTHLSSNYPFLISCSKIISVKKNCCFLESEKKFLSFLFIFNVHDHWKKLNSISNSCSKNGENYIGSNV